MADTCSECGQVVSKAVTMPEILAALVKFQTLDRWALNGPTETWSDVANLGKVRVVDVAEEFNEDPGYDTVDIYVVFEIMNHYGYYRMDGEMSSYEGNEWKQSLRKVMKQKREVYVYE